MVVLSPFLDVISLFVKLEAGVPDSLKCGTSYHKLHGLLQRTPKNFWSPYKSGLIETKELVRLSPEKTMRRLSPDFLLTPWEVLFHSGKRGMK